MSTVHRIHDVVYDHPMGDIETYFDHVNTMVELNSGTNDFQMVTHDAYAIACPINAQSNTRFRLTDSSMDIVDISQGYINLKCHIPLKLKLKGATDFNWANTVNTYHKNITYWFVGFKSAAHLIKNYTIYSNGKPTVCKQLRGKQEQAIVYSCKSKEERQARPGMYSPHKDVLKMRECVCGTYIQQPVLTSNEADLGTIILDLNIQVDDLLPLSAMTYFPRFCCGELELEVKFDLDKGMVFCPIPYDEVLKHKSYDDTNLLDEMKLLANQTGTSDERTVEHDSIAPVIKYNSSPDGFHHHHHASTIVQSHFTQCGDYARSPLGLYTNATENERTKRNSQKLNGKTLVNCNSDFKVDTFVTIEPDQSGFYISEAKSYVYGFGISTTAKQNMEKIFENGKKLTIPAQWIDHHQFPQKVTGTTLSLSTVASMYQCGQAIFTFPNTKNQLTVSHNPYLDNIKCQIGNRIIPDKPMSSISKAYSEMALSALGFDSLFAAPNELINALVPSEKAEKTKFRNQVNDDSDFMFVADLERNGNGAYCDGMTARNASILLHGNMLKGDQNPHYYEYDITKDAAGGARYNLHSDCGFVNIFLVCDCYWQFTKDGGVFVKDQAAVNLTTEREISLKKAEEEKQFTQTQTNFANYNPFWNSESGKQDVSAGNIRQVSVNQQQ